MTHKICDACETVAHCSKHGCIPLQPQELVHKRQTTPQPTMDDAIDVAFKAAKSQFSHYHQVMKPAAPVVAKAPVELPVVEWYHKHEAFKKYVGVGDFYSRDHAFFGGGFDAGVKHFQATISAAGRK